MRKFCIFYWILYHFYFTHSLTTCKGFRKKNLTKWKRQFNYLFYHLFPLFPNHFHIFFVTIRFIRFSIFRSWHKFHEIMEILGSLLSRMSYKSNGVLIELMICFKKGIRICMDIGQCMRFSEYSFHIIMQFS